jgi:hypothetical protein
VDDEHWAASVLGDGAADTPEQQTSELAVATRPQHDQVAVSFLGSA